MQCSRRAFSRMAASGLPLLLHRRSSVAQAPGGPMPDHSIMGGIRFGVESFSFHDLLRGDPKIALPMMIDYMKKIRLTEVELLHTHAEPYADDPQMRNYAPRDTVRKWRETVPMSYFADIRKQFDDNGMLIWAYDVSAFTSDYSDLEIDRTFEAAHALGCSWIGSSNTVSMARRLVPFAEKHQLPVAMHNHNAICDDDELATVHSLENVLAMSSQFAINLDTGHFAAGNNDNVAFILKHHDRIPFLHIRDRKRNDGRYTANGKGDANIKQVLTTIRDNKFPIRGYIEYEYASFREPVDEINVCLEYCREALA
jgi:sugar phosphate isomerase/epimerase